MTSLIAFVIGGLVLGFLLERIIGVGRGWRRRLGITTLLLLLLTLGGGLAAWFWANSMFDRIEKIDVGESLGHGSAGTNYLLVGIDNDPEGEGREHVEGARSDTIMILNIEGDRSRMLSLNRDLWVQNPATGEMGRINATYRQGPENLIRAITVNFEIPIDRYVEIDFTSFAGVVDALGGIDLEVAHPAFDHASGLHIPEAGTVHLDGDQALAYVRSREYTEVIDGQEVRDPTSDLGRVSRQQKFLRAIMAEQSSNRNPLALADLGSTLSGGLRVDHRMSMIDAARFAWRMSRLDPETVVLPVERRITDGSADVLELAGGAEEVLATFR